MSSDKIIALYMEFGRYHTSPLISRVCFCKSEHLGAQHVLLSIGGLVIVSKLDINRSVLAILISETVSLISLLLLYQFFIPHSDNFDFHLA